MFQIVSEIYSNIGCIVLAMYPCVCVQSGCFISSFVILVAWFHLSRGLVVYPSQYVTLSPSSVSLRPMLECT